MLTEEEKLIPYAKYFDWQAGPYDEEAYAAYQADQKIPVEGVTLPEQISDLLKPGYLPYELGYCELPDGTAYVANKIRMPYVTSEMFPWYLTWFGLQPLRYKLWWPQTHYGVEIDEATRAQLLDTTRPCAERIRGTSRTIREDMGAGPVRIKLTYLRPEQIGFDMDRYHEPNVGATSINIGHNLEGGKGPGILLCHFMRSCPEGGVELRTRCWQGWDYDFETGRVYRSLPEGGKIPLKAVKAFWHHNIQEFSRLRDLLPLLYQEYGGRPLDEYT